MKFKVEFVYRVDREAYVMGRQLETGPFSVSVSSRLGRASIKPVLNQPRKLRSDGSPDLDVFAFVLTNPEDAASFPVGKVVDLEP